MIGIISDFLSLNTNIIVEIQSSSHNKDPFIIGWIPRETKGITNQRTTQWINAEIQEYLSTFLISIGTTSIIPAHIQINKAIIIDDILLIKK